LIVLLLFVGSGAAALVYEIVWFQLLQFVIGSSSVSIGVLLGMFMGGMGLGSLLAPRLISDRRHPLRVYAWLELAIGGAGLLLLAVMPLIARVYTAWGGEGVTGLLLRGLVAGVSPPVKTTIRRASWRACTPPTRSARSSVRSRRASCWSPGSARSTRSN
jgi:spermidine synthase